MMVFMKIKFIVLSIFILTFSSCSKKAKFFILETNSTAKNHKIFCSELNEELKLSSYIMKEHAHMEYSSKEECEASGNFHEARYGKGTLHITGDNDSCITKGRFYYSDINSYPVLSNGKLAEDIIKEKCSLTNNAFN